MEWNVNFLRMRLWYYYIVGFKSYYDEVFDLNVCFDYLDWKKVLVISLIIL